MEDKSCCQSPEKKKAGFWQGFLFGLLPHSFCLAFIIFSILGATLLTGLMRQALLIPYFFQILVVISLFSATISAGVYFKRSYLSLKEGIRGKWRYLLTLYGTTIAVNLLLFMVIFPLVANMKSSQIKGTVLSESTQSKISLEVAIPCPGHAPLIIDELGRVEGISWVEFKFPNLFEVNFDSRKISPEEILTLEIFKTFKASIL